METKRSYLGSYLGHVSDSIPHRPEDASKALEASQGKMFFGTKIKVTSHEGISKWTAVLAAWLGSALT